jgi:hypothetical protein
LHTPRTLGESQMAAGYMHPSYAESLAEFGTPRELPQSGGWILQRQIPGFPYDDAMGCYPLFACRNWSQLYADLEEIGNELVSLALVADPFGEYYVAYLQRCFDSVLPFKEHFTVDLSCPIDNIVSRHHRYYSRKALRNVHVECCEPTPFINDWVDLYATLIKRHNITGLRAFSRASFEKQLSVPGMIVFRAEYQGATIGAHLWYVQGQVGYSHLEAVNLTGYKLGAAYALHWSAIEWFSRKLRWLDLGAGAGSNSNKDGDGLSQFKRGWSTNTRPAYFCSRIFDQKRYMEVMEAKNIPATDYFPAYRVGEFD